MGCRILLGQFLSALGAAITIFGFMLPWILIPTCAGALTFSGSDLAVGSLPTAPPTNLPNRVLLLILPLLSISILVLLWWFKGEAIGARLRLLSSGVGIGFTGLALKLIRDNIASADIKEGVLTTALGFVLAAIGAIIEIIWGDRISNVSEDDI